MGECLGGGRGGGGGGGPRAPVIRSPQNLVVKTNLFQIDYSGDRLSTWTQYKMDFVLLKGTKYADRDTWQTVGEAHPDRVSRMQSRLEKYGSTEFTRKICQLLCQQVQRDLNLLLVTDSAQLAISARPLWNLDESPSKEFFVKLDRMGVKVILHFTNQVPLGLWFQKPTTVEELATFNQIKQSIEIIVKHGMGTNLVTVGKNPDTFFLPDHCQMQLMGRGRGANPFASYYDRPGAYAPRIGIKQSARFSNQGKLYFAFNNTVDWLFRGGGPDQESTVPVLDVANRTIAGVQIPNLNQKIPGHLQKEIEDALSKMTFTIKYQKGPRWEQGRRALGKSDQYIRDNRVHKVEQTSMKAKFAKTGEPLGPKIKWGCDEESFEKKEGDKTIVYNIATYFKEIYDVDIRYTNMPVISTARKGWFPVEFLYQEVSRVGGNTPEKIQKVLAYHDNNAGTARVEHLQAVRKLAFETGGEKSLVNLLKNFSLSVHSEPESTRATQLPPPPIEFSNRDRIDSLNGSWNLRDKKFYSPADLPSYAVVDIARPSGLGVEQVMKSLFDTMERHGMRILNNGKSHLRNLIVRHQGGLDTDSVMRSAEEAARRAKDCFLQSTNMYFGCSIENDGKLQDTWLIKHNGEWHRIPREPNQFTHVITNAQNGSKAEARVQFLCEGRWLDPSEVAGDVPVQSLGYKVPNWNPIIQESEISDKKLYNAVDDWQLECPAMLFVYLPEKETGSYNCVKSICDLFIGGNTQCIVQKTASGQKQLGQYCSNIALKVNTKLSNKANNAHAWTVQNPALQWVPQLPTMIFGYSVAHGRVNGDPSTALAGSVCLLSPMQMGQAVRFQKKSGDVIDPAVLKELVRDLAMNFFAHKDEVPERIIVFRDGGSEGSFQTIKNQELAAVREALCQLNKEANRACPYSCEDRNCVGCAPTITFIVSNEDHNLRIVPENANEGVKGNVPSGTLVDHVVDDYKLEEGGSFSFLLTAQGGLKGTSKPMYYRCILNENERPPMRFANDTSKNLTGLDKSSMHELVYGLAFQYGSATKSPRKVPVLLNSEKLANRAINYGPYLSHVGVTIIPDDNNENHLIRRDETGRTLGGRLFENYGVFDDRCFLSENPAHIGWRAPFRPHITG